MTQRGLLSKAPPHTTSYYAPHPHSSANQESGPKSSQHHPTHTNPLIPLNTPLREITPDAKKLKPLPSLLNQRSPATGSICLSGKHLRKDKKHLTELQTPPLSSPSMPLLPTRHHRPARPPSHITPQTSHPHKQKRRHKCLQSITKTIGR